MYSRSSVHSLHNELARSAILYALCVKGSILNSDPAISQCTRLLNRNNFTLKDRAYNDGVFKIDNIYINIKISAINNSLEQNYRPTQRKQTEPIIDDKILI